MKNGIILFPILAVLTLSSCNRGNIAISDFGTTPYGESSKLFTLTNRSGAYVSFTDYGARVISIAVPDRNGALGDVIVGYGKAEEFDEAKRQRFVGCVLGRVANRVRYGKFTLDGQEYNLDTNSSFHGHPIHSHGGSRGFDSFVWESETLRAKGMQGVRFHRVSPDGEMGYPGNCDTYVTYWWTDDNTFRIEYGATTDKPTVINMSNHSYFNLEGNSQSRPEEETLTVYSDSCVVNGFQQCPVGMMAVEGSIFDSRTPHPIDTAFWHSACYPVRDYDGSLRKHATLYDRSSGRGMDVWTTEPAMIVFNSRGFEGHEGKYGPMHAEGGVALETMHFVDSPNQPQFPSVVLRPGETYSSATEWRFFAE